MSARLLSSVALLALLEFSAGAPADVEAPSREDVAKRAKAATAFLEIKPRQASAFCVHASGLFVTNEHVVRDGGNGPVTLVLNSGTRTQKVYKASVVRRDKNLDLALLRVDGSVELPVLPLGSDDNLSELQELVTCGFPFGTALGGPEEGSYPTISINTGKITALRLDKDKALARIQLDAALNPGNSGGPVLDGQGKVVGVVVSGIQGAGVNMAVPVSHVSRFLARPDLSFTPPEECRLHQEVAFQASAVSILPAAAPLELELVVSSAGQKERRYPMKENKGVYEATAVPFPEGKGPLSFPLQVKFDDGTVSGRVEDRTFRVGEQSVKLSQVLSLRPAAKAGVEVAGTRVDVELSDRRKISGRLADLDALAVQVGGQSLQLNLAGAVRVEVDPPDGLTAVSCAVVARQGDKEVGRVSAPVYLEGIARARLEAVRDGKFIRPPRGAAPVSYLRAVSSPGDYIGQGKSYWYSGDELTVRRSDRGVQINVGPVGGWTLQFGGPRGHFLEVGEYLDAKRYPFSDDSPGIEFTGNGRGCNQIAGKFAVWELEVKGNEVVRLAIDFVQRCEQTGPPLSGMLRFNSSFH
jgi:hypothetical protein